MKDLVINSVMNFILKYNNYDEVKKEELEYGLISIYLLIVKLIIILLISILLNVFKEVLIFTLIYIPIRSVSFGLHATKSWVCLILSTFMFVGLPLISKYLFLPIYIKSIIGIIAIILMFKNAPADTKKRPIVNKNRRLFFKYFSVFIAILYSFLSITLNDNFITNGLLFVLIIQCIITSPLVYKIFKLPYDNYKNYNLS